MKNMMKLCALLMAAVLVFGGCKKQEEGPSEDNPTDFSYDMLDISTIADEIYDLATLGELTAASVQRVTDETTLSEQYYLNLDDVIAMDVRSAEGKYGVADVAIIRVKEGKGDGVIDSLERRKDDRINEFSNYDVYDSYAIAMNADIYQTGELVVMLMLDDDAKPPQGRLSNRIFRNFCKEAQLLSLMNWWGNISNKKRGGIFIAAGALCLLGCILLLVFTESIFSTVLL